MQGLHGIDVSTFNGAVDWAQAADAGVSFAFAKASEGLTIRDDRFAANWAGMKDNGVARGAYHFFRADDDGAAQADVFLACVGSFEEGDLPPVLDWETNGASDLTTTLRAAGAFMSEVQSLTGLPTIVYTTVSYWSSLGDPANLPANSLWVASDAAACPVPPSPWTNWLFWQYSAQGTVPGLKGAVDLDLFGGSLGELLSLTAIDGGLPDAGHANTGHADAGETDAGEIDAGRMTSPNPAPPPSGHEAVPTHASGCEEAAGTPLAPSVALLALLLALARKPQVSR